jgi:hypothetical protein
MVLDEWIYLFSGRLMKCPYKYKYELVEWLVRYKGWKITQANQLSKKQLYAIWYKGTIRRLAPV